MNIPGSGAPRGVRIRLFCWAWAAVLAAGGPAPATEVCPFTCADLNGDGAVDLVDFDALGECLGEPPGSSQTCRCADMDGSETVDLADFALFAVLFQQFSDELPPNCTGAVGAAADLTAFRPQHGGGYAPFARTAVPEADEDSPTRGPGVRINAPGDVDPAGEDDLVEVVLEVSPPGAALALRRSDAALQVWLTRDKLPGTEIAFTDDKSDALPLEESQSLVTLWVEWAAPAPGLAELHVEPPAAAIPKDTLVFHVFTSIVVALGGENQVPTDPPDALAGTFVVAVDLYHQGYDVHMYDEDDVGPDGSGAAFDDVADAVQHRGVAEVAIFGYSHGGGSTHDLAALLDLSRPALGVFEIRFTSYVDGVRNSSDIDVAQELRRPPSTNYHLNHYQHGVFWEDLGLDGGPVPDSNPPPSGLDVETTPWGADATHFEVDDFLQVRDLITATLAPLVPRVTASNSLSAAARVLASIGLAACDVAMAPVLLFTLGGGPPAPLADYGAAGVQPDPPVQTAIALRVTAASEPATRQALNELRGFAEAAPERFIRQLVHYFSHAASLPDAMVAGAVLHELAIPEHVIVHALVPLLGTTDDALDRSIRSILGGYEGRAPGRRPDFSAYRELIERAVRNGAEPPTALISHLYAADAGEALLTLMRAYQLRDPAELKRMLWAEHVVSDVLWKQQYGFLPSNQVEGGAAAELAGLSSHRSWWVRLYVSEIMRQHPAFRQPKVVERLRRDAHPRVRVSATGVPDGR